MADIPPSYVQSMSASVLDLIAPYLDTLTLHSLTLVSHSYNEAFMPHLWGSPASHFVLMDGPTLPDDPDNPQVSGSHDDMVYVALTRFKRTLKKARLSTRCLVHTLFLPPAQSEIYGGPNPTWLKEILDGLPSLQSLCVGGLPFFDHHSLSAVHRPKGAQSVDNNQTYPLKLLIASKEPNTTSIGLSLFLPRVRHLVYLDLSYTTTAKDPNVLSSLSLQLDLQVLKLRGISMKDAEAEILANAIGRRVRLLDIAENLLSDMAVRSLLQACFQHGPSSDRATDGDVFGRNVHLRGQFQSWPVSQPPAPDFLSLDTLRSSNLDKNLRIQLTNPLTGRLAFEDIPHAGLTHLYITGNLAITVEGVRSLLDTGKLHVLDAGEIVGETVVDKYVRSAIDTGRFIDRPRSLHSASSSMDYTRPSSGRNNHYDADIHFPGTEKLIPVLRNKASKNLTYFRIDHAIITKEIGASADGQSKRTKLGHPGSPAELSGQIGVTQLVEIPGSRRQPVELQAAQIFELDATPTVRAELPGDPIHFAITPPVGEKPAQIVEEPVEPKPVRGEGPFAPEIVETYEASDGSGSTGLASSHRHQNSDPIFSPISPLSPQDPSSSTNSSKSSEPLSIDAVVVGQSNSPTVKPKPATPFVDRRAKIEELSRLRPSRDSPWLSPSSLPNLRTLILTNVPSQVPANSTVLSSLKRFISFCAVESQLSLLRARTDYSLPPGRARFEAERKHARSLFALESIILEIAPVESSSKNLRDWKHTRQRLNQSRSSTGDHDSEALWCAAADDFSFFGEAGEEQDECGIYAHEPGMYFPQNRVEDRPAQLSSDDPESSIVGTPMWMYDGDLRRERIQAQTTTPTFRSPRELPLGRNRRSSTDSQRAAVSTPELPQSPTFGVNNPNVVAEMSGALPDNLTLSMNPRTSAAAINAVPVANGVSNNLLSPTTPILQPDAEPPLIDLVAELSTFRKERKALYEAAVHKASYTRIQGVTVPIRRSGISAADVALETFVEGHWKGEISVVRNKSAKRVPTAGRSSGMVDIYGNYFERGYLYS